MENNSDIVRSTKICGIIYDLDGTIIDSAHIHEAAWHAAGEEFGVEIPDEDAEKMSSVGEAIKYIDSKSGGAN